MIALLLLSLISGCAVVPVAIVGATAAGLYSVSGRKGTDGFLKDFQLKRKIKEIWEDKKLKQLPFLVYDSKVMIYGYYEKDIQNHANAVKDVCEKIIDATYKKTDEAKDKGIDQINDKLIYTQIAAGMLAKQEINSRNYKFTVENGVLYIIGTAYTEEEKTACLVYLESFKGIKRVESDIEVIPGGTSILLPK